MNIKEFDLLLKRVNIEDNTDIKRKMLSVIEQYLGALSDGDITVGELAEVKEAPKKVEDTTTAEIAETPKVEAIQEEVTEVAVEETVQEESVTEEVEIIENVEPQEEVTPVEIQEEVPVVEETVPGEDAVEEATEEVVEETVTNEVDTVEETTPVVEEVVEEVSPVVEETVDEAPAVEETAEETIAEATEFVESFGLISTTKDEHLTKVVEKGGVLFRDKRSFMLGLLLEDELLALAKTTKIDEFPEEIRNHLKKNGFVSVDVVSIGDVTKKSRARYVDVTFRNFAALAEDHWIVQNVNNLLDHGIAPEGKEEPQEEAKQEEAPVQAELKLETEEVAPAEMPHLVSTFIVNPSFVETFKAKKEQVMAQPYGITSDGTVAKLFANNGSNTVILAANPKTTIKEGTFSVKIVDYVMTEENGQTTAQFTFDVAVTNEAKKEEKAEQPAPAPQKANVPLKPLKAVPADFPLVNNLKIKLHPTAGMMLNADTVKKMTGKPVSLAFKTSENGESTVAFIHDVFEMGVTENTLTNDKFRDSKWIARVTNMELVEEGEVKTLHVQFDALSELEMFLHETKEEALDVHSYVAISEETYGKRQQEIAQKKAAAQAPVEQPKEEPKEEQPKEEESAPKVEELMNKEYNPESAKKLIDPKADADYSKGYQELVHSQSKDIGGAMQNIQNKTAMTPQGRQEVMQKANNILDKVIKESLNETNIHTKTEEKATGTTQVVGNLQEGAGNLTETETVINFITPYPPQSWQQSVGKQIELRSELAIGNGPISGKRVSMIGKNGKPVAQGQVDMSVALLADGNQHTAELIGIEGSTQLEQGYSVALRLGSFKKMAIA